MTEHWLNEDDSAEPSLDQVTRYFGREMPAAEARRFGRQLAASEAFAARAVALWETVEAWSSVRARVDEKQMRAILARERGLRWRERLPRALAQLSNERSPLGRLALTGVAAALELTLDGPRRLAQLLAAPAREVLPSGTVLEFDSSMPQRLVRPIRAYGSGPKDDAPPASPEASGTLTLNQTFCAHVLVDERTRTLTVRFEDTVTPAELLLVPGDPNEAVRVAPVVNTPTGRLCEFAGLPDGEYLLVVPSAAE